MCRTTSSSALARTWGAADLAVEGAHGRLPSQLFIKPFPAVLIEYTEQELRALDSLPLRLSPDEQRQLVLRVLEIYWSYASRYFSEQQLRERVA